MRNFNDDNRSGRSRGGRRFDDRGSDRSRSGSRDSGRSQMHDAVCSDCSNNCQVPFKPSSGKPIYCSDCFEKRGNGSGRSSFSDRGNSSSEASRPAKNYDKQFKTINAKLDIILKAVAPQQEEEAIIIPEEETTEVVAETEVAPEVEVIVEPEVAPEVEVPEIEVVAEK
jgi:CxxC-x17-CxxC domain-containing protein